MEQKAIQSVTWPLCLCTLWRVLTAENIIATLEVINVSVGTSSYTDLCCLYRWSFDIFYCIKMKKIIWGGDRIWGTTRFHRIFSGDFPGGWNTSVLASWKLDESWLKVPRSAWAQHINYALYLFGVMWGIWWNNNNNETRASLYRYILIPKF